MRRLFVGASEQLTPPTTRGGAPGLLATLRLPAIEAPNWCEIDGC